MLNNLTSRNRKQKYTISDHKTIREDWPKDATLALSIWISCSCSGDDRGTEPASPWDRTKDKQRSMAEIRASQFAAIDRSLSPVPLPRRVTTAVLPKTHCCYCRVPPFSVLQTFFFANWFFRLIHEPKDFSGSEGFGNSEPFCFLCFLLGAPQFASACSHTWRGRRTHVTLLDTGSRRHVKGEGEETWSNDESGLKKSFASRASHSCPPCHTRLPRKLLQKWRFRRGAMRKCDSHSAPKVKSSGAIALLPLPLFSHM
jgi:hypothetical protein